MPDNEVAAESTTYGLFDLRVQSGAMGQNTLLKILFHSGRPLSEFEIADSIEKFSGRFGYQRTVRETIKRLSLKFDRQVFMSNTAQLMTNFKMTRNGVFKGVSYQQGEYFDPNGVLDKCWIAIEGNVLFLRNQILKNHQNRYRVLVEFSKTELDEATSML